MSQSVATVQEHYAGLLAHHYRRMAGDFDAKVAVETELLEQLGLGGCRPCTALDLGAGPGYQSAALAKLGFQVTAVDTSSELLAQLRSQVPAPSVITAEADMVSFTRDYPEAVGAILCMGDTITHLEGVGRVRELLDAVRNVLAPGGIFVVTYRDLSNELTGTDRFIPVVTDDDLFITCFLEYAEGVVAVHDLVHVRDTDGTWRFHKSAYPKLRLAEAWLKDELRSRNFDVQTHMSAAGMTVLAGRLPL